jgi:hypothetical protein
VLPALSVHVPVVDWFEPSVVTIWLTVLLTGPEIASVQDQLTVTLPLFQPLPLAGVRFKKVMVGLVASRLTVRGEAFAVNPAWFVHDPLKVVPALFVESV